MNLEQLVEFLPFLLPLVIIEFALFGYTLYHILTHKNYKVGNRTLWLIITIVFMNFIGPILYFVIGKED
jgi:hypothetical protein